MHAFVEILKELELIELAFCYEVKSILHVAGEAIVYAVREIPFKKLYDSKANEGWNQRSAFAHNVVLLKEPVYDGGICGWSSYSKLFKGLDQ